MNDNGPDSLGHAIRQVREEAGLSIRQLAAEVGVSPSYIGHLETGTKTHPAPEVLQRIAAATHTEPSNLLKYVLPSTRMFFRQRYGVSDDEAVILANLLEHQIRELREGPHGDTK